MKSLTLSLALSLATLSASRPAAAEEKQGISKLDGQLVPVGDHNQYLYAFKRWNVSANPIGMIIGLYGASVSYAPHDHFTLRFDANYIRPIDSGTKIEGFELGVGAPIYFRRAYQGVFLEPGVIVRQLSYDYEDYSGSTTTLTREKATVVGPQVLVGWHWIWDSGLNIAIALGAGRNFSSNGESSSSSRYDNEIFANGYLRFGYAF